MRVAAALNPAPYSPRLKRTNSRRIASLLVGVAIATIVMSESAFAIDQYWDTNGALTGLGGTGTWDTTITNLVWNTSSGIGVPTFWINGSNAFFQGTAGTVTVGGAVSAIGINFGVGSYLINGTNTVTLTNTGTSSAINATNTSGTNTISADLVLGAAAGTTQTFTQAAGGTLAVSGVISSTNAIGGLTFTGGGAYTLSGADTYSGTTTINAGTLKIDNNNTTTARLANTSSIAVNSGGTLLLAQSGGTSSADRINNTATMTLNGGTFNTGGLQEHGISNNTAGIGVLTLQSSSIIDMGSSTSIIAFANSKAASWTGTLKIYNWTGTPNTGGGTDQLYFGSDNTGLTSAQLSQIQFFSDSGVTLYGGATTILGNGEVVPVPEPGTWIGGALALGAIALTQRRRLRRLLKEAG